MLLIRSGAAITERDSTLKQTALHYAIFKNCIEVAKLLVERGAPIQLQNSRGELPFEMVKSEETAAAMLRCAIDCGKPAELAAPLLERFPQARELADGQAALGSARARHDAAWIRLLSHEEAELLKVHELKAIATAEKIFVLSTRYGAPATHPDADPLGVSDHVKAMLEAILGPRVKCFNPNRDNLALQGGDTALANGVWLKTWREMLSHARRTGGAVVRLDFTPAGLSPMQEAETDMAHDKGVPVHAVEYDCEGVLGDGDRSLDAQIVELATAAAAPAAAGSSSQREGGMNARPELHDAASSGDVDRVKALLEAGADADAIDESGNTALLNAAFKGHVAVAQVLVLVGQVSVDKRAPTSRSHPPLIQAAQKGYVEIVRLLLMAQADPHANGGEALELSAERGHSGVVQLLLGAQADPNASKSWIRMRPAVGEIADPDAYRRPLTIAAANDHIDTVRLLLAAKADASVRDENGLTPASYALERNEPILFALLDPAGARAKGVALRAEFQAAKLVHVISTRFRVDKAVDTGGAFGQDQWGNTIRQPIDPRLSARVLKQVVEADELVLKFIDFVDEHKSVFSGAVKVFDPNADNAFLMEGVAESANAIWLLNWREQLENARRTGGAVLQLLVAPGLSKMQLAEASMAADRGVRIVTIDCTNLRADGYLRPDEAITLPAVIALREEARRVRAGELTLAVSPSRHELEGKLKRWSDDFRTLGVIRH